MLGTAAAGLGAAPKEVDVSWGSAASSMDMELSTPRSPFLENHLPLPLVHLRHGDDPPFAAATPLSLTLSRGTGG